MLRQKTLVRVSGQVDPTELHEPHLPLNEECVLCEGVPDAASRINGDARSISLVVAEFIVDLQLADSQSNR